MVHCVGQKPIALMVEQKLNEIDRSEVLEKKLQIFFKNPLTNPIEYGIINTQTKGNTP